MTAVIRGRWRRLHAALDHQQFLPAKLNKLAGYEYSLLFFACGLLDTFSVGEALLCRSEGLLRSPFARFGAGYCSVDFSLVLRRYFVSQAKSLNGDTVPGLHPGATTPHCCPRLRCSASP